MEISGKEQLDGIVKELQNAEFTVKDVKKGSRSRTVSYTHLPPPVIPVTVVV